MIFPIAHENMEVRRLPVVTISLIASMVLVHILASPGAYEHFGDIPARGGVLTLVTYAFLHEGWFHLIGNAWFLFLAGAALEDRWGRIAFSAFYLVTGVVAALANRLIFPSSELAIIGASGAVAGAMGAFFVLFATTRVQFVLLWRKATVFSAPAYAMLLLWLGIEVVYAMLGAMLGAGGTAVAHWTHVGGFIFGAIVAAAFRALGLDHKLDDAAERAFFLGDDPRIEAARELLKRNQSAGALAMLEGLAKEKPESFHVWEALRDAAMAHGDEAKAERAAEKAAAIHRAAGRKRPQ